MYERQSRLRDRKQERLIKYFVAHKTIREAAELVGVHRNTAASIFTRLRKVITEETEKEMVSYLPVGGEIELYVIDFCQLYKNKWDPGYKVPVFTLFKRGGKIYTEVIPNTRPTTLMTITERLVKPDSVIYTDGFPEWNALDDLGFDHVRPKIVEESLWDNDNLLGIHEFWMRVIVSWVAHFHGIPKQSIHLFLKEFEWRYNGLYNSGDVRNFKQGEKSLTNQLETWVRLRQNRP